MISLDEFGLTGEPTARDAIRAGATVVTMSGDKLLGGPQAGLILGKRDALDRIRKNPLTRSYRVDKLTLAALEATLTGPPVPVRTALQTPVQLLLERAERLAARLREAGVDADAVTSTAAVGGGGAPGVSLPSAALRVPAAFAVPLRSGRPPVVGRVEEGGCLLDLRTVSPEEDEAVLAAVLAVARGL